MKIKTKHNKLSKYKKLFIEKYGREKGRQYYKAFKKYLKFEYD